MYSTICTEMADGVGRVTLNRPDRMNAWTPQMGVELREAITDFDRRSDVRVILVTGAGRAFCAGADMSDEAQAASPRPTEPPADQVPYWEMNTPIIAAMNGAAVGAGMTMAMQWDLRVVAEGAKYGFVFNRRGLLPELGSTWLIPRLIGLGRAMDVLLTGRIFTGAEAVGLGIANEAVPAEQVLSRATEIATDIAHNVAPVSAALTKRLLNRFLTDTDRPRAESIERALSAWTVDSADSKEGIRAFVEKRRPAWHLDKNNDFPKELFDG